MNRKELAIAAMRGETTTELAFMPITMSFAAEKLGVPYKQYATDAETQVAAQIKIAELFGTAQVSVISDPGVEAHDLGARVTFPEDAPPFVNEEFSLLADKKLLAELKLVLPENGIRMSNRLKALRLLSREAGSDLLVEGWVEGPCAEAADLRGINRLMMDFFDDTGFVEELMAFVTRQEIAFALRQVEAGAQIIGIGDAASSLIGPDFYKRFVAPKTKEYINAIHKAGARVRLHICGRTEGLAESWKTLNADMIDIDYGNSMEEIRNILGPEGAALAGNLDPVRDVRNGNPEEIESLLESSRRKSAPKYIVGAGCEIPRDCPDENLHAMRIYANKRGQATFPISRSLM